MTALDDLATALANDTGLSHDEVTRALEASMPALTARARAEVLLRRVQDAAVTRATGNEAWKAAIIDAHNAGVSPSTIAGAAGVSRQRVAQLLEAARTH